MEEWPILGAIKLMIPKNVLVACCVGIMAIKGKILPQHRDRAIFPLVWNHCITAYLMTMTGIGLFLHMSSGIHLDLPIHMTIAIHSAPLSPSIPVSLPPNQLQTVFQMPA